MRTALILVMLTLVGCGSHRQLQNMSAGSTGCRPQAIEVSDTRGGAATRTWTARCNGATYQCTHSVYSSATCTRNAHASARGGTLEDRRRQERFEFSREGDVLRGVRATFDTGDAQLTFLFAPEVSRTEVYVSVATGTTAPATCTELAFEGASRTLRARFVDARASFPRADLIGLTQEQEAPTASGCGRAWALRRADVAGFTRFAEYIDEALANAPVVASTASSPVEAVVRARLDARRDALRACAGSAGVVSIEASWDAAGQLSVHVRGQEDAAVNGCVQATLGEQRVETTSAGRLIHVLEPAPAGTPPPAPAGGRCAPNQRSVPAGAHCQECGPLDGCVSSPATCRPACSRQRDCSEGSCDTALGACVLLCG